MLLAPLQPTVAKLDISRLLESSPSPQPRPGAPDSQKESNVARSASDPPPARILPPVSHRSSVSSTRSGNDSFTALSASSVPAHPLPGLVHASPLQSRGQHRTESQHEHQYQFQQHNRSRVPSIGSLPLPTPGFVHAEQRRTSLATDTNPPADATHHLYSHSAKRPAPGEHVSAPPAKRQSKWTAEEDALVIELRGAGMKWEDISKRIPGRTPLSCRLHYQNYIERRSQWDEDRKNRLARLYERLKPEMWKPLAAELNVPWRAAEAMHWQLGQVEMARRAGVTPFSISSSAGPSFSALRMESGIMESPSAPVYPPPSPHMSANYPTPAAYSKSSKPNYFDERDAGYRTPAHSRPRSISASSSDDRKSGPLAQQVNPWSMPPFLSAGRPAPETWSLPRLPEVDDVEVQTSRAPDPAADKSYSQSPLP